MGQNEETAESVQLLVILHLQGASIGAHIMHSSHLNPCSPSVRTQARLAGTVRAARRGNSTAAFWQLTVGLHHPLPNVSGPLSIRGDAVLALSSRADSFGVEPGEEKRSGTP